MGLCVRINDFGAHECQEYCIDNPRMKCRGTGRYTIEICIRIRMYIAIDISVFRYDCFHIFPETIAKHSAYSLRMSTRNFNKRISMRWSSFGELSETQTDNTTLQKYYVRFIHIFFHFLHFPNCVLCREFRYACQNFLQRSAVYVPTCDYIT